MNMKDRVLALTAKTDSGELAWRATSERDSLALELPGATVVMTNYLYAPRPTVLTNPSWLGLASPKDGITVAVRNPDGKVVRSRFFKTEEADYEFAEALWKVAYDKAYQVTQTLSALDAALEGALGGLPAPKASAHDEAPTTEQSPEAE